MAIITTSSTDTICAISTPAGVGGIAVIRISGQDAIGITDTIFTARNPQKRLATQAANTLLYGTVHDGNETIDEVVAAIFRAPHSFTGKDTVELSCHGSLYIQQRIIALLLARGCRMAEAGEFTRQAFASGRIDLSQAEAIADVIAANSAAAHKLAVSQMRGQFSQRLAQLRSQLLEFVSLIELELDFSEEDVEFANRDHLAHLADEINLEISRLTRSFAVGNAIKNGIPTAIVGETNAGKSTLLNRLVHDERALVSDIHGTTRDVIEDTVMLGGVEFRFIDTAGIRNTTDRIENMGIERTFGKLQQSTIVIWLIDGTTPIDAIEELGKQIIPLCNDKQLIIAFNKTDLLSPEQHTALASLYDRIARTHATSQAIFLSAKNDEGIDQLEQLLIAAAQLPEMGSNDVIVTNLRHYDALTHALEAIQRVQTGLTTALPCDFIAQDIRECMHYLGEITGEITTHEILGSIFSRFCVGK